MAKIFDTISKLEKTIDELASRRGVAREPIEIQRGILDEVEGHVQVVGRSRRALPFNRITAYLLARDAERRAALQAVFPVEQLARAIRERLRDAGAEADPDLEVAVRLVRTLPSGEAEGRFHWLRFERVEGASRSRDRAATASPAVRLVIVKGRAARKVFDVGVGRTNIGRQAEVTDKAERVVRRNQVIFLDAEDEATRTVSRAQAHIVFTPPSDYRLHDDRSSHGTRVFRQGRTLEIPSGSPRGLKLRSGDEIYFGQACVRFEVPAPGDEPSEVASGRPKGSRVRHKDKR